MLDKDLIQLLCHDLLTYHLCIAHAPHVSVCFSPDGSFAVTTSEDATTKIWDPKTFMCRSTLRVNDHQVLASVFVASDILSVGSADGSLYLWDMSGLQLPGSTFKNVLSKYKPAKFSPALPLSPVADPQTRSPYISPHASPHASPSGSPKRG